MNDPSKPGGGKTITKADIIESVYEKVGFSKKESSEIVEIVFETIKTTLEKGEKIKVSGFGKFEVRQKNTRRGRNPQTGSELQIPARRVLSFKPSQVLKNALAGESIPEGAAGSAGDHDASLDDDAYDEDDADPQGAADDVE